MSRSGYTDHDDFDLEGILRYGRWRGVVASSIRGKRGQALLKELAEAMDAMPKKELIAHVLESNGQYCTLGVVGAKRGLNLKEIDPEDSAFVASTFNIAEPLAREIVYMNDEYSSSDTPEERWTRMRKWVQDQIKDSHDT